MSDILKALDDALAEEIRLEQELLAVGARKRGALVKLDVKAVDQATAREQSLLVALGPAAECRLRRTADAARHLGVPEPEASVTRVAHKAEEPLRTRLLVRADELKRALREVGRVNAANCALTEQSLAHVKLFFRALGGAAEDVTYSRKGLEARPEAPKIMIDEVV